MKSINSIPTSKIQRAGKLVTTGAKVGVNYLKYYGEKMIKPESEAKENLNKFCLQGGMDPKILFKKEDEMIRVVDKYLNIFKERPYIFNLGHGLLPETNPEVLQKIVERVNNFK